MSDMKINPSLEVGKAYAYRKPRPVWGEPLPQRKTVKDGKGKDHELVAEGEWWNQYRTAKLMLWLDDCVRMITSRLNEDITAEGRPLMQRFVAALSRPGMVSEKRLKTNGSDISTWTVSKISEACALRPDLLLAMVDAGVAPDPPPGLIPEERRNNWPGAQDSMDRWEAEQARLKNSPRYVGSGVSDVVTALL